MIILWFFFVIEFIDFLVSVILEVEINLEIVRLDLCD